MKVSVIIITYNQENLVDRAIAGVMHQKGDFDIELLVCNDASTDDTLLHVKRWKRRFPASIRIIDHEANVGFRANYLSGFRAATGKYLAMCDADDYWTDDRKLARQVEYMEAHPECAITFHRVTNVYSPSRVKTRSNGGQAVDTTIEHLSRSNYITNLSVMYRRELVPASTLPDWLAETALPDYAYHMLYAMHGTIHFFPKSMGVYNQNAAGEWSLRGEEKRLGMALDVRERLLDYLPADSVARRGLRDASVDILVALLHIADDPLRYAALREKLSALAPEITDDDLATRLEARRRLLAAGRRVTLKSIVRSVYRRFTRLLPAPAPC